MVRSISSLLFINLIVQLAQLALGAEELPLLWPTIRADKSYHVTFKLEILDSNEVSLVDFYKFSRTPPIWLIVNENLSSIQTVVR